MSTICYADPTAMAKDSPKEQISIRLDPALIEEADKLATHDDRSRSYIIERALREYVAARRQQQQPAKHQPRQ